MIDVSVRVHDDEEVVRVASSDELDRVLQSAGDEARTRGRLNIIVLEAPNGNELGMVVGGDETVLVFTYGHRNPPYCASRGPAIDARPVMTCYVGLVHHTEFPRTYVIPYATGLAAAHAFAGSGALPSSVAWIET